jgi:nicotinamide-nucleotide amidase
MAEINKRQAYIVEGAEILQNPNGTAPGQWIEHGRSHRHSVAWPAGRAESDVRHRVPAAPGSDASRTSNPHAILPGYRVSRKAIWTQSLRPCIRMYTNPSTTILAAPGDIQIHLRARCESEDDAERLLADVGNPIEELLGRHLFSRKR